MQARSALFDLYGDYLRPRGGRAPVAALVRLLTPLGIAAPAVRTAVSRMVRQGWLDPLRLANGPGYSITPKAARRLDEAAARIYRTGRSGWDGRFDLLVLDGPANRRDRQRLGSNLSFMGYGMLDERTWVATRPGVDIDGLLAEAGVRHERFTASHAGGTQGAMGVVRRAWDLGEIGEAYERFVAEQRPLVTGVTARSSDEDAYAARFRLVHAWRTFLFRDPQLPPALLPDRWPGTGAASFFDRHAARLRPAADRFVDHCLGNGPAVTPTRGRGAGTGTGTGTGRRQQKGLNQ
ncbi:PaaX family transcriptional regulator C-terminal domain-containing protein [Plantactinospora siamensis]|uniref:PaaX family transcriptional regulator C-terminal domain-containing protein n=1 Tax=Plantactinospora siamensis TaxID=555372 RepID=A0ABV6NWT8_9ACTN